MVSKKRKMRLPMLSVLLFAGIFIFGTATGAFMYATGKNVIETVHMEMVSHTEYRFAETGQIVARLVDFKGDSVVTTNCTTTILYPNKTAYINDALMTDTGTITGDHYYSFSTPNGPEGVYEYQATCYYAPNKNASVTNSFHLSSALTSIQGNLTNIQGNITNVQNTLSSLALNVSQMNASLSGQITDLSGQLNANVSQLLVAQQGNTTAVLNQLNSNISMVLSQMNSNTSTVLAAISGMSVTVNLTPVLDAIDALNTSMQIGFANINANIAGNASVINSNIASNTSLINQNLAGNFSVITSDLVQINTTSNDIYTLLQDVNLTTGNIYTYLTGTLTTKVDNVLTDLGVINATVNRIELVADNINSTTTTILQNQQDQVQMSVFSG